MTKAEASRQPFDSGNRNDIDGLATNPLMEPMPVADISGASNSVSIGPGSLSPLAANNDSSENGGLKGLIRTIKRRQGIFLFTFALVSGALALDTLRQRVFSPVYEGGFQIQITNPFEQAVSGGGENKLESVARQAIKTDVPSLIVLMKSPLLVKPVADRMGVSMHEVIDNLAVAPASNVDQVLNVSLRWRDPIKGRLILNELSKDYTKFSQVQRQSALNSGVSFLEEQAPNLIRNVSTLEAELKDFRKKYNLLDPTGMATNIMASRDALVAKLMSLQVEQTELRSKLASAQSGRLTWNPSGAPTAVEQLGRQGLVIPGRTTGATGDQAGQTTPNETLYKYEKDLANARAIYKDDSPIVQSILAQRNAILPVVRKEATDAIRAQLLANESQQDELNRQILLLNENFKSSQIGRAHV